MLDWYKDAIFYEVSVKAFADSNGDGIGDLRGLTGKLDYLRELGVDAIWMLPIFPSPLRDDGYDVADYMNIHPYYGTLEDFKVLLDEAHKRDLRIIVELVVNHTSDQHPWFQASRDPQHPEHARYRDWYVWSDTDQRYTQTRIIFLDTEPSNWTFDPVRGQYFWHRFFSHQPDLNYDNPEVQRAMLRVVQYWIDLGVDGFRIDAPPYLYEREGTNCENLPETHAYLKRLRAFVDAYAPGTFLLSEANMWPEDVIQYFGNGDEVHMNYHFPLMPRIFMALAKADRAPILAIMARTPELPAPCQWGTFLRCHDELTLEMVTPEERAFMWDFYAPEPRMRLNLGIRRRLAPLLDNDRRRIEVANSMLLTLIGSPFIYYGDEIGMGDNIWLNDRDGVRTPMQWDAAPNAGFSDAPAGRLYSPVIDDPVYGYQRVNVAAQRADENSLWHWMRRVVHIRKQHPVFGRGTLRFLEPDNPAILAYLRSDGTQTVLVVNNLSAAPQKFTLDLSAYARKVPRDLLADTTWHPIGTTPYPFTLAPYGYHWLSLE
ncbi:MAG TPA: maltose alpha-D-glucosyltransferase [Anaerolineae bacterium]|nr:maltose alpha-D-glucosyltransferase [Anaerolineae bacterium]HQK12726.1 maltose alpha-D-glucosyltransferase [Anaerolineae bacterium]